MKPVLRQILSTSEYSFLIRKDIGENMVNSWHYHPEVELLFIKNSVGTWLIGDHIGHFTAGDIVLIGANLPHCFRHEYDYIKESAGPGGETICIKFSPEIFGPHFLSLPEAKGIKHILTKCDRGLKLTGRTKNNIPGAIEQMLTLSPGRKLICLLSLLEEIAENKEYAPLSSMGFRESPNDNDRNRIKVVLEYTFTHYDEKITIEQMAELLNMTTPSFCRYFKSKTNKTYLRFVMEVRIGHACRLLVEEEKNVREISYTCGYNNISHFNHQFKFITGKTPLEYKHDHLKGA
jgi:AraC-like DNA-binding protein